MTSPFRAATLTRPPRPGPHWGYWFAVLAVFTQLAVPANLLDYAGVAYANPNTAGGTLNKFHPSTYLVVLAVLASAVEWRGQMQAPLRICLRHIGILMLLVMMVATACYAIVSVGTSGTALYIDNYISCGLLAAVGMGCTPERRRSFGLVLVAMCLVSALIVVPENALQQHLIPYYVASKPVQDTVGEFRGAALFDHPLTAACVTMMAVFLVVFSWRDTVWKGLALALLGLAMIAYGGRTALGLTAMALLVVLLLQVVRGLASGQGAARPLLLLIVGGALAGVAVSVLLAYTDIGERLVNTFYFDSSAEVRNVQWYVLDGLDLRQWLFGVRLVDQERLNYLISLNWSFEGIENFWLLAFVSLGIVGFSLYLAALLPFLSFLWRIAPGWGRLLLVCVILVASSSNSLGRKSNVLFLLTASMLAASASRRVAVVSSTKITVPAPRPLRLVETPGPA